jgi:hypothetical protein
MTKTRRHAPPMLNAAAPAGRPIVERAPARPPFDKSTAADENEVALARGDELADAMMVAATEDSRSRRR